MSVESFGIEKEFLSDLLRQAREGRIQLPEFQRGWVWPEPNIIGLLSSISLGYPVGTTMMLRTGGQTRFKERPVEGIELPANSSAERLLLDGQQRLTSLYQALMLNRPVRTQNERKHEVEGWFYVDIDQALDETYDRENAFRFIPADRVVRTDFARSVELDLSTPEKEYAAGMFPLTRVFDADDWAEGFREHHDYDKAASKRWQAFNKQFVKRFEQYLVPVIELSATTPREAVCQVFEKVNTGGITLTVFELLTATYAADEFDLRQDWQECQQHWADGHYQVLHGVAETDFLQAITLLATYRKHAEHTDAQSDRALRIGCRRSDMLRLPLEDYRACSRDIVAGLKAAAHFLHHRYIFDVKSLPYGSQLIPLAAIHAVLGQEWNTHDAQQKITRWYWSGVFGELYSGTTETRFARDLPEVVDWVRGKGPEPRTVQEAQFPPQRLHTLRTRNSAAYKGIYALLMAGGAQDWISGNDVNAATYFDEAVDIHHIFPKAWCTRNGVPRTTYDSIVNKTPLSAHTNRVIGSAAPSAYLARLIRGEGVSEDALLKHLQTHLIDTKPLSEDDFWAFFERRERELLDRITAAMGTDRPDPSEAAS
ncbi:GmrSD restriction endonuclease domain-containing protein [Allosalinactinospora lopnorensis]|uniref:GmrSD restriction endonuclease domain-containing protein n=1 Tax=Allosalinactinospora lopnorensis TaxID=1352348 RepID=UPI000623C411|nr:DUF262 domain-containing protein [Allosalinactinospora lopnorensis]